MIDEYLGAIRLDIKGDGGHAETKKPASLRGFRFRASHRKLYFPMSFCYIVISISLSLSIYTFILWVRIVGLKFLLDFSDFVYWSKVE